MLFYTTCGWMMWNWMSSSLFAGATVVTFDGFAAYPKLSSPWDLVQNERITHLGSSPRFFQACRARVRPMENNDLSALRVIFSTGSPLTPEDFEYALGMQLRTATSLVGIEIAAHPRLPPLASAHAICSRVLLVRGRACLADTCTRR